MPNFCNNILEVYGDKDKLEAFLSKTKGENGALDFNSIIAYPEEYKKLDDIAEVERSKGNFEVKDGYSSGGYEWCIKNWGTKWNAIDPHVELDSDKAVIIFDTAWSPPEEAIEKASNMFEDLEFILYYSEPGNDFSGKITYHKGDIIEKLDGGYMDRKDYFGEYYEQEEWEEECEQEEQGEECKQEKWGDEVVIYPIETDAKKQEVDEQ